MGLEEPQTQTMAHRKSSSLLERADQVLQRAQQTQSQLRKQQRPSIEIPQQQNYESKIDRMLTQSPKRKPERIY